MSKIKSFKEFLINEATLIIKDPIKAGNKFGEILSNQKGVKEQGANAGPRIKEYLASTNLPEGNPWCMAFVYYIFNEFSKAMGIPNVLPKTAGVEDHWNKADRNNKIDIATIRKTPSLLKVGDVFIMDRGNPGSGKGHAGIVVKINSDGRSFVSMEGNSDDKVNVQTRTIDDKSLVGFLDYFLDKRTPELEKAISKSVEGIKVNSKPSLGSTDTDLPDVNIPTEVVDPSKGKTQIEFGEEDDALGSLLKSIQNLADSTSNIFQTIE